LAVIEIVVFPVGKRAPQVPEDTKNTPLIAFTKGWLIDQKAKVGDTVTVRTMTDRTVQGTLTNRGLAPVHTYGGFVPELLEIHKQVRSVLFGGDA
jgi:hypothetical protein